MRKVTTFLTFAFSIGCVSRRFPQFNMKELVKNLNQKCRDAGKNQECRDAGKKNKEASSSQ